MQQYVDIVAAGLARTLNKRVLFFKSAFNVSFFCKSARTLNKRVFFNRVASSR